MNFQILGGLSVLSHPEVATAAGAEVKAETPKIRKETKKIIPGFVHQLAAHLSVSEGSEHP